MNKTTIRLTVLGLAILLAAGCASGKNASGGTGPSASAASPAPSPTASAAPIAAKVTRVIDGDTIEVAAGDKKETVRLILVDTPETKKPGTDVQPFGQEASDFTAQVLENRDVRLERDVSAIDQYGRSLYYVWLGDRMFNEMLLEKGLARVAVYPPDVKYEDEFRTVEQKAKDAGIGIWSVPGYVTDKGFDRTKRTPPPSPLPRVTIKPAEKPSAATVKPADAPKVPAATVKSAETPAAPEAPAPEVSYRNCTEAHAAGVYNLKRGEPGYRSALDRDNDGVACEK